MPPTREGPSEPAVFGGSSNGRTADSDSAYLGSNPSPPANTPRAPFGARGVLAGGEGKSDLFSSRDRREPGREKPETLVDTQWTHIRSRSAVHLLLKRGAFHYRRRLPKPYAGELGRRAALITAPCVATAQA